MPDLINNPGNLTDVAANYRKAFAPFTLFGTRQLRFYNIYINGLNVNAPDNGGDHYYANSYESPFGGPDGWDGQLYQPNYTTDSVFSRIVSAIQTQAEIYGIWHPEANDENSVTSDSYFTVMVAGDTHADAGYDNNLGANSMKLQDVIYDVLSGTSVISVNVYQAFITGDYMDRDVGTSLQRGTPPQLSQEEQAAVEAVKTAQAALRAIRKGQ